VTPFFSLLSAHYKVCGIPKTLLCMQQVCGFSFALPRCRAARISKAKAQGDGIRCYAGGAVRAAASLMKHESGLFDVRDVLREN
jgi:hypothetical protein